MIAMNKQMTFSIIGCQHAHIGIFIKEMLAIGHRCAGLYEPDNIGLAEHISAEYNIQLVDDRESLLGREVDIVGCASVNNEKIDVIELCEVHGKPVMIDKPAVTSRDGLNRLRAVIERQQIEVGMLLTERFRPEIRALKRLIEGEALGELVHISMRKPHQLNPTKRPAWHFSKKESGGIIMDLLVHDFDLLRYLTGQELRSITGFMSKLILPEHPEFYDAAVMQVLMNNGLTSQLYADWHTPEKCWTWGDGRIFISGTKGTAEIRLEGEPLRADAGMLLYMNENEEWRLLEKDDFEPFDTISEDFLSRIAGGPHVLSHQDIIAASEAAVSADENAERILRV